MDDVSFRIAEGEVAALLGPNGSGKSTVLRTLAGYFSPTTGHVRLGAIDPGSDPLAARRLVGYLPEQVQVYPDLTVRRYLQFVAGVRGLAGRAQAAAVEDVIARCNLDEVARRPTAKLSRGFRQRVGLAQALVGDPPILVLDEPTVGLDPLQAVEMRALIAGLRARRRTVLLSTHLLGEASQLCSRIVILARGRLVAEDSAAGLAERLAGLTRVTVRLEGPAEAAAALLGALPGVAGVEVAPPDGGPGCVLVAVTPEPLPLQRAVGAAIAQRGWTLLELSPSAPTLEDLFVRLVTPGREGH